MSIDNILSSEEIATLNKAQDIRNKLVDKLLGDGEIPTDKSIVMMVLEALKDSDKSIQTSARLKIAHKANETAVGSNKIIADFLSKHTVLPATVRAQTITALPDSYVVEDKVDGEMDIGISDLTYASFIRKNESEST